MPPIVIELELELVLEILVQSASSSSLVEDNNARITAS